VAAALVAALCRVSTRCSAALDKTFESRRQTFETWFVGLPFPVMAPFFDLLHSTTRPGATAQLTAMRRGAAAAEREGGFHGKSAAVDLIHIQFTGARFKRGYRGRPRDAPVWRMATPLRSLIAGVDFDAGEDLQLSDRQL
jgi:hypothetical protein